MKKKLVALSLTLAMLTSVVMGCGGSSTETASTENAATENVGETTASGGGYTIATVVKDMSDPWALRHIEGVKEYEAKQEIPVMQRDLQRQIPQNRFR